MIKREIKLVLLITVLCALAALGVSSSYAGLTGTIGRITPLLIVIALIVLAISLLEMLTQKVDLRSSASVSNTIGSMVPIAAGILSVLSSIPTTNFPMRQIAVSNENICENGPHAAVASGSNALRAMWD
jgi:hypothetical protein